MAVAPLLVVGEDDATLPKDDAPFLEELGPLETFTSRKLPLFVGCSVCGVIEKLRTAVKPVLDANEDGALLLKEAAAWFDRLVLLEELVTENNALSVDSGV